MNLPKLGTDAQVTDRRANMLVWASMATLAAVLVFAAIAVPKILSNESTTKAVARGNEVTACRAAYRIDVDDASASLQRARATLDVTTSKGLAASVNDNDAVLAEAVLEAAEARAEVESSANALDATTTRYRELVTLSRTDPDQFLSLCRQENS